MTATRERRTRSTWIALALTVVAVVAAAFLGLAGVRTLADSRAGRAADPTTVLPTQRIPFTPTALVGTVDDDGRLTSVVVMAVEPDGTGGSIVQVAARADANSGNTGVLEPLNAVLEARGPEEWRFAVETLTSLSFDVVELVDDDGFVQLVTPLGDLPVELPTAIYDASTGEQWVAGSSVMPSPEAARVLTAVDPEVTDYLFEPSRAAIWQAVADRVGAGIGSASEVVSDADLARPADLDGFVDRLFAGSVQFRALAVRRVGGDRVADELPTDLGEAFDLIANDGVAVHDRAEMLMVMGAVAPGRVGAPLVAPSFRVVSGFDAADLDPLGARNSDVLNLAIDRLLFAQVNVVSVAELPGAAVPDHSVFVVADPSTVDGVRDEYEGIFGDEIEVRAADVLIEGVDIELILGRDFLDVVPEGMVGVESSMADANDDTDTSGDAPETTATDG